MRQDPKTGRIVGGYDEDKLAKLVTMVMNETDIMVIYDYLDGEFIDDRTKWNYLKEAKKRAV